MLQLRNFRNLAIMALIFLFVGIIYDVFDEQSTLYGTTNSAIEVASDGKVGIGTSTPDVRLHVAGADESTALLIENTNSTVINRQLLQTRNNGPVQWRLTNSDTGDEWDIVGISDQLRMTFVGTGVQEFVLDSAGNLNISGTLTTSGTTCGDGCDQVFSDDYQLPSIEEHAESMWERRHLPAVGPVPENAPLNITETTTGMLNELEKAHIYIAQLNQRIERLEKLTSPAKGCSEN